MSDALLPPFLVPEELALKAKTQGWPDGLLQRAIDLRYDAELIDRWLGVPQPQQQELVKQLEDLVARRERLEMGTMHARSIMTQDLGALADLWDNSTEEIGEWDVVVQRRPNPVAQYRLLDSVEVIVIVDRGLILASVVWAHRNVLVAGKELHILSTQGLRVDDRFRRQGLSTAVRSAGRSPLFNQVNGEVTYFRGLNRGVIEMMKATSPQWWENAQAARAEGIGGSDTDPDLPGIPVSVHQFLPRAPSTAADGIRPATRDDLAACADVLNRTHGHLDFFEPVSPWLLGHRLDQFRRGRPRQSWMNVYGWEDFRVVEENGAVVACGGLWDRGRNIRERWTNRETGDAHEVSSTNVLDFGWADGKESAFVRLFDTFLGKTAELGRTNMVIPLNPYPALAAQLEGRQRTLETRGLQWRIYTDSGEVRDPELPVTEAFIDLRYW